MTHRVIRRRGPSLPLNDAGLLAYRLCDLLRSATTSPQTLRCEDTHSSQHFSCPIVAAGIFQRIGTTSAMAVGCRPLKVGMADGCGSDWTRSRPP